MGKKNKKVSKVPKVTKLPKVTLCTPTFNRRPFIPMMLKCFEHQNYPKDNIEWLNDNDYKYLVISRKRNQSLPDIDGVVVKNTPDHKVTTFLIKQEQGMLEMI